MMAALPAFRPTVFESACFMTFIIQESTTIRSMPGCAWGEVYSGWVPCVLFRGFMSRDNCERTVFCSVVHACKIIANVWSRYSLDVVTEIGRLVRK